MSVVLPVLNRERSLRRALLSVINQTFQAWDCIVVDDGSTADLGAVVSAFEDPRIRYVRRFHSGGPTPARLDGWRLAKGDYVLSLDSDDELYPWALAQGVAYLQRRRDVDLVVGLCLQNEDSRLLARVPRSPRIQTPADFRIREPAPDRVALVRADVVKDWLSLPGDYFAFEAAQWVTTELSRSSLALDEPWALCHTSSADRVTTSKRGRQRHLDDAVTFLRERADLISAGPCVTLDRLLEGILFALVRARRAEARMAADALRQRGISPRRALLRGVVTRARSRIWARDAGVFWM